ncbi:DUF977 family protein [Patescibacteria group bacterium]|nr:DUF977 family protein [Patescibacteria group bacterium]
MDTLFLILIGIAGGWLGYELAAQKKRLSLTEILSEKQKNKKKIVEYMQSHLKITNNDVEKIAGVSDATAERYLNELEQEGILRQIGKGRYSHYVRN